jgi:hypothetical protein
MKDNVKCILAILLVSFVLAIIASTIILLTEELTNIEFMAGSILVWFIVILFVKIDSIRNSDCSNKS